MGAMLAAHGADVPMPKKKYVDPGATPLGSLRPVQAFSLSGGAVEVVAMVTRQLRRAAEREGTYRHERADGKFEKRSISL